MRSLPLLLLACFVLVLMTAGEADAGKEPEWNYTTGGYVSSVAISADGEYIAAVFSKLAPEDFPYVHNMEGKDDMPAHIRSALTSTSETVPVVNGKLSLGTWQGIYIWEHRDQTHNRKVTVSMVGE